MLDAVPGHADVLVGLGAAHGFKFAALFGGILRRPGPADGTDDDLEPFRIDRPALTTPDPRANYLV